MCMEAGTKEQVSRPCVCIAVNRGKGGGEWPESIPIVTTDHTNVCLEAAIRSEGCVYVLGWEHQVPDCRAVR